MLYYIVIGYLIVLNILAGFVCVWDKYKAKKGGWRVPEQTLFLFVFLGGGIGMYITMRMVRHKTKHKRFMIGIPLIIILQLILICVFLAKI